MFAWTFHFVQRLAKDQKFKIHRHYYLISETMGRENREKKVVAKDTNKKNLFLFYLFFF